MSVETIRTVQRLTRDLRGRVRGMIRRAALGTLSVSGQMPTLQAKSTADDADDGVELFEQYGFASAPPAGSEGLVFRVGGERAHSIAALFSNRSMRPAGLEQGEAGVYHHNGSLVVLRNDQTVEIQTPQGASITITPTGAINVTPAAGQTVNLAGEAPAALPVARQTDPVAPSEAMASWGGVIETAVNALAPGTFNGTNSFAGTVSADFGAILQGGQGSVST